MIGSYPPLLVNTLVDSQIENVFKKGNYLNLQYLEFGSTIGFNSKWNMCFVFSFFKVNLHQLHLFLTWEGKTYLTWSK